MAIFFFFFIKNCIHGKVEQIMYNNRIEDMKREIKNQLRMFLEDRGLELYIAANDNIPGINPLVKLEEIKDIRLYGKSLFEIRLMLGLLGRPRQCEELIN